MALTTNILAIFIHIMLKIVKCIGETVISFTVRGPNKALVPIREDCLLGSAKSLAARIRTRKISCTEVVRACIRRIEDINDTTNCAVATRFEEALKDAEEIDKLLASESKTIEELEKTKPFLGVPFSAKDGLAIKGLIQSAGCVARKDKKATEDCDAVKFLREAGGIPLAATNVPELMTWWETNCHLHGRTNNPYHSEYMVGGSSGGEGALIAAAGSMMGIGSDIGGSIRIPAHMCGIFGHKPSLGIVSDKGQYPPEDDKEKIGVVGPMSKFAEDLRPMLKVMSKASKVSLNLDKPVDIKRLRYFYMEDDGNSLLGPADAVDSQTKKAIQSVVRYFDQTYGIKVEKISLPRVKYAKELWWAKIMTEEGPQLVPKEENRGNSWISHWWETVKVLVGKSEHVLEFIMPALLQSRQPVFGTPQQTKMSKEGDKLTEELEALLKGDGIFFYPTMPTPALKRYSSFFSPYNFIYTAVFNVTRMPVTQCPIAQTEEGLPIGIQVVGAKYHDHLTLAVAEELERAFGGWKPPPSQPKW